MISRHLLRWALPVAMLSATAASAQPAESPHLSDPDLPPPPIEKEVVIESRDLLRHMDPKFDARLLLGLGGTAQKADMAPGYGANLQFGLPLHEYFEAGLMAELQSWNTINGNDIGHDRSLFVDFDLVLRPRLVASERVEVYLAIPAGITINAASGPSVGASDSNTGFGFNVRFMAGGRIAIVDGFGLAGEMGYVMHRVTHTVQTPASPTDMDVDVSIDQFMVTAGMFVAL